MEKDGHCSSAIFEWFVPNSRMQCRDVFYIKLVRKSFRKFSLSHSSLDKLEYPDVADLLNLFFGLSGTGRRIVDAMGLPCREVSPGRKYSVNPSQEASSGTS